MASFFGIVRLLFMLSEGILLFVLPVVAFGLRNSLADSGIVSFLLVFPKLISYPLAGSWSDRANEKWLFRLSIVLRAGFCLTIFFVLQFKFTSVNIILFLLMALNTLDGLLSGISTVAFDAALPRVLPATTWLRAQAVVQGADQVAVIAAPLLGSLLLRIGQGGVFLLCGILYALALLAPIGNAVRTIAKEKVELTSVILADFKLTLKLLFESRALMLILILTLIDNLLLGLQSAVSTPLTLGYFGRSEQALGYAISLGGCAALLSVVIGPSLVKLTSLATVWILSYIIGYVGFLWMGMTSGFIGFAIALGFIEISCGIGIYALRLIRVDLIPKAHLGKTLGMLYLLQQSTIPIGGIMVASAQSTNNLQPLLLITTLACLAVASLLIMGTVKNLKLETTQRA